MSVPPLDDEAFVRAVLGNPEELTTWLAYADWLDEHGDPRADFIRLQVRREELAESDPEQLAIRARLSGLGDFDRDWVAVFDRPPIENCVPDPGVRCPGRWPGLRKGDWPDERNVRHCRSCDQPVYFCHDLDSARTCVLSGDRVAIRLSVRREPDDLLTDAAESLMAIFTDVCRNPRADRPD